MKINSITPQYNNLNKQQRNQNIANSNPSFKSGAKAKEIVQKAFNTISGAEEKLFETVSKTGGFQKVINKFAKSNNTFAHLMVLESALLSGFYMFNTLRNKNIDKEQKPQMLINDALVWGASTASTYLVENKISSVVKDATTKYLDKDKVKQFYQGLGEKAKEASKKALIEQAQGINSSNLKQGLEAVSETLGKHLSKAVEPEKLKAIKESVQATITSGVNGSKDDLAVALKDKIDDAYNLLGKKVTEIEKNNFKSGVNKLKTLVIFGLIYRFLGPVVMTPIANKLSSKIKAKKLEKQQQKNQTTEVKK